MDSILDRGACFESRESLIRCGRAGLREDGIGDSRAVTNNIEQSRLTRFHRKAILSARDRGQWTSIAHQAMKLSSDILMDKAILRRCKRRNSLYLILRGAQAIPKAEISDWIEPPLAAAADGSPVTNHQPLTLQ